MELQQALKEKLRHRAAGWRALRESYNKHIALKSHLVFFICFASFAVTMCFLSYRAVTRVLMNDYLSRGVRFTDLAAEHIDPDLLDSYLTKYEENKEYWRIWSALERIRNDTESTFIYVIRPDDSYEHITYYFSTAQEEGGYYPYDPGTVKDVIYEENRSAYRRVMEGGEHVVSIVLDSILFSEEKHHITTMQGLTGSDGQVKGILCVQTPLSFLVSVRILLLKNILIATVIFAVLAIAINAVWQTRSLLKPLERITGEAVRFATENVAGSNKLTEAIKSKDEIGLLAASVDQMEEQVVTYYQDLTAATLEKERMNTELMLAEGIQKGMLPTDFPAFPDRTEFDLYASMDPAKVVGGDFYGFFLIDEDHLCLEIADVSGKGIPAALFMMASKIILENMAMSEMSPARILEDANNKINNKNIEKMFVTVWLGILEISTGRLVASNAGHEYPAVKKPDGSFELLKDKHGFVLGGMAGMKYKDYELLLEPGAKIFTYTDGVPEATNAENKMFGTDNMLEALNKDPDASPEQLLKNVRAAVDDFVKDTEQFDDLTMLCLEYKGYKG